MSLCPEGEYRSNMSDGEFWDRVSKNICGPSIEEFPPDPEEVILGLVGAELSKPCIVCGSTGACAYDSEGRPMIHTEEEDSEDELSDQG